MKKYDMNEFEALNKLRYELRTINNSYKDKLLNEIEQALTELEELKQEVKDRQETEESLGKELIKLGDELEQLKRDVKRFMELIPKVKFRPLQDEVYSLQQKLLKVGKEE